jgi:hypothetical protein
MKSVAEIEHPEVRALAERAEEYVARFAWCEAVTRCALGFAVAGVLGVFRIDLVPADATVDPTVWVVVGDLPPAYIAFEEGDTWQDALRGYVDEMQAWVDAVRAGESIDDLIPVNAAPTSVYADLLDSRLGFLRQRLLDVAPEELEGDA